MLDILHESDGTAISISDAAMPTAMRAVARMEGVFTSLGSAATYAAMEKLLARGFLNGDERVVACNTAVGLQHADVLERDPSGVDPASDEDRSLCEVSRHPIAGARSRGPACVCMLRGPRLEAGALLVRAWERGAGWPAR